MKTGIARADLESMYADRVDLYKRGFLCLDS